MNLEAVEAIARAVLYEGYMDGYAIGYRSAWDAADKAIDALNAQVKSLQERLGSLRNNGGNFWTRLRMP
jgi:flagellar biosynthesis/type III secretory pathway protein FliH